MAAIAGARAAEIHARESGSALDDIAEGDRRAVDEWLASLRAAHSTRIGAAARHLLDAGGKRLRPLLTCGFMRALGADPRRRIGLVAVSEMVHVGSLLHDDVVDGSIKRRGRPAAHVAFDAHTAILAGDLLLSWAFDRLAREGPRELQKAMATAVRDVSEGEVLERERCFDVDVGVAHVRLVSRLKTGALLAYAADAGAILAGADIPERSAARAYGLAAGEAFQAADDLLDWDGDPAQMGKPIGQDVSDGLITLPLALGAERDPSFMRDVRSFWASPPGGAERLVLIERLRGGLRRLGVFEAVRAMARADAARAAAAVEALPPGPWRDRLARTALAAATRSW